MASVFSEIYSGQPRPLPASVTEALAALALARHPPPAAPLSVVKRTVRSSTAE